MPNVYIVNKGGHDFSDATRYGRIQFLSEGIANRYAVNKMYRDFSMVLRASSPDDYILITGLTVMSCVACACFSFIHGRLNILLYKNGKYVDRKLMLSDLLGKGGTIEDQIKDMEK